MTISKDHYLKLLDVIEAARDSDLFFAHLGDGGPCRWSYRHCTCGRDKFLAALKKLDKVQQSDVF